METTPDGVDLERLRPCFADARRGRTARRSPRR